MDVRAADTSSLAAKRLELDKTKPVNQKHNTAMDERLAAKAARETGNNYGRNNDDEQDGIQESHSEFDTRDNESTGSGSGEHHVLDVRV